jgi:acetaldehyde dehydrogenase (acetylating)
LAGISVPNNVRCLIADCGGVGRDFPWSIEKLSPTLAFFVVDGIEQGANKCEEILRFGGMGHTSGMHTKSREAAVKFGEQMPASRVIINSPTTHGAIGLSTDLSPSMTLGCGSWGGNVTSDNVSPIHLMDIKRVAFETKPIGSQQSTVNSYQLSVGNQPNVKREDIASIVDSFLRKKLAENPQVAELQQVAETPRAIIHEVKPVEIVEVTQNATDFVSEDDVKSAMAKGEKIWINEKTIITPSARDIGEANEIFAKV